MTKELLFSVTLDDCDVQTKRGHGKGGQNRNKRDTAVRIVHKPSGAVGECQEQRTQYQNKRTAFKRMSETTKFKVWLNREVLIKTGEKTPEQRVAEMMESDNIRTEVKIDGRWTAIDPQNLNQEEE